MNKVLTMLLSCTFSLNILSPPKNNTSKPGKATANKITTAKPGKVSEVEKLEEFSRKGKAEAAASAKQQKQDEDRKKLEKLEITG